MSKHFHRPPQLIAQCMLFLRFVFSSAVMVSCFLVTLIAQQSTLAAEDRVETGIPYIADQNDAYQNQQCRLDLYIPATAAKDFYTVIWFHGGGLRDGNRFIPAELTKQAFAVVAPSYRLHPQVKSPTYVEDAAAAVAWVFKNIATYGGSPKKIIISGHSAGGYLTLMVGLDKRWLAAHDIDANQLAGLAPLSGQTVTHSTIRSERNLSDTQLIVDEMAPLFHIRNDLPPTLLVTGDRELEIGGRYEENALLWRMLRVSGLKHVALHEIKQHDHGQMQGPAHELLIEFVSRQSELAQAEP